METTGWQRVPSAIVYSLDQRQIPAAAYAVAAAAAGTPRKDSSRNKMILLLPIMKSAQIRREHFQFMQRKVTQIDTNCAP